MTETNGGGELMDADSVWADVQRIRETGPVVHNITNFVVMNTTANALLALGASPVMAHAPEELEEMVAIASAVVINIGTLDTPWIASMRRALKAASARAVPAVLDPVGAGATTLRTRTAHLLLESGAIRILRGNGSEIGALHSADVRTKGVDSLAGAATARAAAQALVDHYGCAVAVSGAEDLILGPHTALHIANGHPMMTRVTGLGCTASALAGAFAAVNTDYTLAAAHAMAVMGVCGEIAAESCPGPGSLQVRFLDALYSLSHQQLSQRLRTHSP
jgi:hydroxyethylthiazole kinase